MSTQTPPERCPVCGDADQLNYQNDRVHYRTFGCGAEYHVGAAPGKNWYRGCGWAMTAALRCGATLHPTPLEQARAALVDAAVDFGTPSAHRVQDRYDALFAAVAAYRAWVKP